MQQLDRAAQDGLCFRAFRTDGLDRDQIDGRGELVRNSVIELAQQRSHLGSRRIGVHSRHSDLLSLAPGLTRRINYTIPYIFFSLHSYRDRVKSDFGVHRLVMVDEEWQRRRLPNSAGPPRSLPATFRRGFSMRLRSCFSRRDSAAPASTRSRSWPLRASRPSTRIFPARRRCSPRWSAAPSTNSPGSRALRPRAARSMTSSPILPRRSWSDSSPTRSI